MSCRSAVTRQSIHCCRAHSCRLCTLSGEKQILFWHSCPNLIGKLSFFCLHAPLSRDDPQSGEEGSEKNEEEAMEGQPRENSTGEKEMPMTAIG